MVVLVVLWLLCVCWLVLYFVGVVRLWLSVGFLFTCYTVVVWFGCMLLVLWFAFALGFWLFVYCVAASGHLLLLGCFVFRGKWF